MLDISYFPLQVGSPPFPILLCTPGKLTHKDHINGSLDFQLQIGSGQCSQDIGKRSEGRMTVKLWF